MKSNSTQPLRWPLLPIAFFLIFSACQTSSEPNDPRLEQVQQIVDSLFSTQNWPALSIGIIQADQIQEVHKGQLLNGRAPNSSTFYEVASLTKTFTGTLLAHALVEGKTTIDQDIRLHLADSFPNLAYQGNPITFRHLATHQSGLPRLFPDTPGLFDTPDWDNLPP